MLTVIAYGSLAVSTIAVLLATLDNARYYWLAALGIYIFSFLSSFSIGQLTVGITFVFLSMAVGHTIDRIRKFRHAVIFAVIGLLIGAAAVLFVDDYWLFYPLWLIFPA